jgi:hypothetical protein
MDKRATKVGDGHVMCGIIKSIRAHIGIKGTRALRVTGRGCKKRRKGMRKYLL